jgi:translation initiation factor eIF-2B subunit epsilon
MSQKNTKNAPGGGKGALKGKKGAAGGKKAEDERDETLQAVVCFGLAYDLPVCGC